MNEEKTFNLKVNDQYINIRIYFGQKNNPVTKFETDFNEVNIQS